MAEQRTKEKNSSQNKKVEALHRLDDGAERGTNRGPHIVPNARGDHNVVPAQAAYEGSATTRTPEGSEQGVTTHTQSEESARQKKVVKDRPDARASLNHSKTA